MLSVCDGDTKVVWAVRVAVSLWLDSKILSYLTRFAAGMSWRPSSINGSREGDSFITPSV